MGDIVPSTRTKALNTSSIHCPMLNSTNYTVWAMRMRVLLRVHKVWETVEKEAADGENNDVAMALIFQSVPEMLILQVGKLDTAKKVWDAIKSRHVGAERVREARLQTLMAEFDKLKMKDTEMIDDFSGKLSEICSRSAALGTTIKEPKIVKKFLKSLSRKKYIHMVASLEQVLYLNTTSFEDIIRRLKAYEERIREEEEETQDDLSKLMYANMKPQENCDYSGENRGRGQGGHFYSIGRGHGRFHGARDLSEIICYRCDKTGHYTSNCPDRLVKLQETQEDKDVDDTHEADRLMMHEVVYRNEKRVKPNKFEKSREGDNVWYLDNGASNHMTGNRNYISKIDETVTEKVRFGDDSQIDIKGKGSILFVSKDGGKKVLANVYFIPDLKSNIISLGQATEAGCDVRMRGDYLTLHDQDGRLLMKAHYKKYGY
ncbi:uncharacterized protein LOC112081959 [Eutrema salsugineum]|uniref:uncharacterized protein LOC112081959 n=1 Tax=Eutrema salsugineum TaxID=72664 RepID=UPI000CECEEBB|nr:uncharacterized protein LOC112081959 [Eutrema salsugineum]